jgi:hypothetical protein
MEASQAQQSEKGFDAGVIIKSVSLCLPEPVLEALREAAFKDHCKIHDLVMQGIDLALRKRGYPSIGKARERSIGSSSIRLTQTRSAPALLGAACGRPRTAA